MGNHILFWRRVFEIERCLLVLEGSVWKWEALFYFGKVWFGNGKPHFVLKKSI